MALDKTAEQEQRAPRDGAMTSVFERRMRGGSVQLIDFTLGTEGSLYEGKLHDVVAKATGRGVVQIDCVYLRPTEPMDRNALGELESEYDHLLIVLSGSGRVSGGGKIRAPIAAGQAAYFPKEEAYLIFAETLLTGVLIKVNEMAPAAVRVDCDETQNRLPPGTSALH